MLARLMYVDHAERGEEAELTAATIEVRAGVHMGAIMFEWWTAFSFPVRNEIYQIQMLPSIYTFLLWELLLSHEYTSFPFHCS